MIGRQWRKRLRKGQSDETDFLEKIIEGRGRVAPLPCDLKEAK